MLQGYAPLSGRMKAVKIVLTIAVVLAVLAVVSDALQLVLLNRDSYSNDQALFNDLRVALIGWLQSLGFIGGAIALMVWLSRAYKNLESVDPAYRRYGDGWEIGSWFIPFLNWYRPPRILNDVVRGSTGGYGSPMVGWWWATFWIAGLFNTFAIITVAPEFATTATTAMLISDVFIVICGLLLLKIASTATDNLESRALSKARSMAPREGGRFDRATTLFPTEVTN